MSNHWSKPVYRQDPGGQIDRHGHVVGDGPRIVRTCIEAAQQHLEAGEIERAQRLLQHAREAQKFVGATAQLDYWAAVTSDYRKRWKSQ